MEPREQSSEEVSERKEEYRLPNDGPSPSESLVQLVTFDANSPGHSGRPRRHDIALFPVPAFANC